MLLCLSLDRYSLVNMNEIILVFCEKKLSIKLMFVTTASSPTKPSQHDRIKNTAAHLVALDGRVRASISLKTFS